MCRFDQKKTLFVCQFERKNLDRIFKKVSKSFLKCEHSAIYLSSEIMQRTQKRVKYLAIHFLLFRLLLDCQLPLPLLFILHNKQFMQISNKKTARCVPQNIYTKTMCGQKSNPTHTFTGIHLQNGNTKCIGKIYLNHVQTHKGI